MVDREVVLDILQTLAEYVGDLTSYRELPRERVIGDRQIQSAVRYALQADSAIVCDRLRDRLGDFELFLKYIREYLERSAP